MRTRVRRDREKGWCHCRDVWGDKGPGYTFCMPRVHCRTASQLSRLREPTALPALCALRSPASWGSGGVGRPEAGVLGLGFQTWWAAGLAVKARGSRGQGWGREGAAGPASSSPQHRFQTEARLLPGWGPARPLPPRLGHSGHSLALPGPGGKAEVADVPHSASRLPRPDPPGTAGRAGVSLLSGPRRGVAAARTVAVLVFGHWFAGFPFLPHQAGGSGCRPPSAMPHSIVLYKQRILAKIQKTLPRKKGKL